MYRQLGAVLVPRFCTGASQKAEWHKVTDVEKYKKGITLSPWFKELRPSWGCVVHGADPLFEERERTSKILTPRFLYFVRYEKAPPEVQPKPAEGDVYSMTVWWDSTERKRKWGIPNEFAIFVSKDGKTIKPLKTIKTRMVRVGKSGNNFNYDLIPQREWYLPHHYEEWAESYGVSADLHLAHIFCDLVRDYEWSQYSMARVSVQNGDLTASFGINPRRLAYFFQDRDIIVTVNGSRKRILHYVRPHIREDGTAVKAHFRGAREFKWAGYSVLVTIPGRDHIPLPEYNVGSTDPFWVPKTEKPDMISPGEIGRWLADAVRGVPLDERGGPKCDMHGEATEQTNDRHRND